MKSYLDVCLVRRSCHLNLIKWSESALVFGIHARFLMNYLPFEMISN